MGLSFPNHVGLAAGLDKDGKYISVLHRMGFGHIEVGTVTPKRQLGNDKPRMFRLPKGQAIINRMGFNNDGVDALVSRVEKLQKNGFDGVLGINIGKNKYTEDTDAINDYLICMNKVYGFASYIIINISSPNTPGLRDLQYGEALHDLLSSLKSEQARLINKTDNYVPLALKVAPDLSDSEVQSVADAVNQHQFDAIIATNTTLSRELVKNQKHADEMGGLSGLPLTDDSVTIIKKLRKHLDENIPVIGVGGIMKAEDAVEKIDAGADLVQVYTGFIYHGPKLIAECIKAIQKKTNT